ncbi:hypothetical protein ACLB2K_021899 [Fragaria x ananassa]
MNLRFLVFFWSMKMGALLDIFANIIWYVEDFNPDCGDSAYIMGIVDLLLVCVELSYRPEAGSVRLIKSGSPAKCHVLLIYGYKAKKMATDEQESKQVVVDAWQSDGNQLNDVRAKLAGVSKELQRWNENKFGLIPNKIRQLNKELEQCPFDSSDEVVQNRRNAIVVELNKSLEIEESIWRQRSIINWLQEGDQNTKFFHGFAKGRGRKNRVLGIMSSTGEWIEQETEIQQAFNTHFSQLFTSEGCDHMELVLDTVQRKVTDDINAKLNKLFTKLDIDEALKQMGPDKSPGEDGFSARFYQAYWEIVGDEVSNRCLQVLNEGASVKDLNHTLLALIPKIENPQGVADFRPISLCNVLYKLISKAMVNRMKLILPEAMGMINPSRGLRQGDPLSPYLFLLCSEGLTSLFQNVEREGFVHGAKVSEGSPPISHLLFADDSMLFGRAEMQELTLLKQCLLLYERVAGQKVNFQKSAVAFGPGLLEEQKSLIATFLGVPVVPFHEKYLGLPTVAGRNKKEMFKRIHERLDQHLQGWQLRLLSKAGKTILIKAVAQAIPSYTMNKMDGGLGFRDIECFNQALLATTVWRIVMQPTSLANRVLQAKYVHGGDWATAPIGPKPSFIWRSLVWGKELLCAGIRWRVGNGTAIRIWEDKWLPSPWSFRVVTPRFMDSNTRVSTLMTSPSMWDVIFIQTHFLPVDADKILSIPVCERSGSDVAIWHYTNDGYYTVKSGYWLAMELKQVGKSTSSSGEKGETNSNSIWSIIWGLSVPNKVKLFLWRAYHAFLPCVERLFKRKVCSSDICSRCGGASESVLHSLWACRIAQKVWKCSWLAGVVKLWKFQSFSVLLHRVAMEGTNKELDLFGLVCSWWIWKCRNDTIHGKEGLKPDILVQRCKEWQSELAQTQSTNKPITGFVVKEIVRTPQVKLKEWLKEARLKGGTFRAFHPDDRYCHVCLSKDHWSSACPYQIELPVGATVGPFAEILCLCCGEDRPHPGVPGVDWKARVVLKDSCMLGSPEALRRAAAARGIKANTSAGAANGTNA